MNKKISPSFVTLLDTEETEKADEKFAQKEKSPQSKVTMQGKNQLGSTPQAGVVLDFSRYTVGDLDPDQAIVESLQRSIVNYPSAKETLNSGRAITQTQKVDQTDLDLDAIDQAFSRK